MIYEDKVKINSEKS